jgi:hypothetical protein
MTEVLAVAQVLQELQAQETHLQRLHRKAIAEAPLQVRYLVVQVAAVHQPLVQMYLHNM